MLVKPKHGEKNSFQAITIRIFRWLKRKKKSVFLKMKELRNSFILIVARQLPSALQDKLLHRTTAWFSSPNETKFQHPKKCIYCGNAENLSDEHIVPAGLSGDRKIFKGSCEKCRLETHEFETSCLNAIQAYRYKKGIGSRRLEERKKTLKIWILQNWDGAEQVFLPGENPSQKWELIDIPISEHADFLGLPYFDYPKSLADAAGFNQSVSTTPYWFYSSVPLNIDTIFPAMPRYIEYKLDHISFLRMIAKIAHYFSVWTYGVDNFKPYLCDFITGKSANNIFHLIGCDYEKRPSKSDLYFQIGVLSNNIIIVHIKLFANLVNHDGESSPLYVAIVGKLLNK